MLKKITQSFLALLLMMVIGVVSASAKTEKVHATFESPSNTNTTWNSETRTFTWSTTYYNQLRNMWTVPSSLARSSVFCSTRVALT